MGTITLDQRAWGNVMKPEASAIWSQCSLLWDSTLTPPHLHAVQLKILALKNSRKVFFNPCWVYFRVLLCFLGPSYCTNKHHSSRSQKFLRGLLSCFNLLQPFCVDIIVYLLLVNGMLTFCSWKGIYNCVKVIKSFIINAFIRKHKTG